MKTIHGHKKKIIGFAGAFLFTILGTYNAIIINSDSNISGSDYKFVKRLDEVYGVVTPGRLVAASVEWKKLKKAEIRKEPTIIQAVNTINSYSTHNTETPIEPTVAQAAIQEELELNLVEVSNPRKWAQNLSPAQFSGSLSTREGTIESLSVSLPNGEGVSVSFSEMAGNVFEYDYNGEVYSGMMYQMDQYSYMITLTNGPMEGTRLRFSTAATQQVDESQNHLAETHNIETGTFGAQAEEVQPESIIQENMAQNDQQMQNEAQATQGFNMEQGAI